MNGLGSHGRFALLALAIAAFSCGDDDDGANGGANDGGSAGSSGSSPGKLDACKLVTAQDASTLFGQPAKRDSDELVVDPALLGQCQWTYEVEDDIGRVSSQSLQFYVWDGAEYNSAPPDADPLDVGEDGYVKASEGAGVDVGWVQGGRAMALSYFSIGDDMPTNLSMVEPMTTLAQDVSDRL